MEEQIKELKKEVEVLKKEIADIKSNYLTLDKLADYFEEKNKKLGI